MIKAVIIDDEPKAIQSLMWELSNFKDKIVVEESFTEPEKAAGAQGTRTVKLPLP